MTLLKQACLGLLGLMVVLGLLCPGVGLAADQEGTRFYLGIRAGLARLNQEQLFANADARPGEFPTLGGGSVGVNFGKYWGVELAVDGYEPFLSLPSRGRIGEYTIATFVPQIRLRYPLLNDRFVPYASGGVGLGFTEFNDRTLSAGGLHIGGRDYSPAATIGTGFDYFIASNLAVGLEAKYVYMRQATFMLGEETHRANLDAILLSGGLKIFFPEGSDREKDVAFDGASRASEIRPYLSFRTGVAVVTDKHISPQGELPRFLSPPFISGSLGVNIRRYWGLELALEGYETHIDLARDKLGEFSVYTIMPQGRFRYPIYEDRLVPYLIGGIGIGFSEFNDRTLERPDLKVTSLTHQSLAAAAGVGIEYFIASNLAVGLETKYVSFSGATFKINDDVHTATLSAVHTSVGIRIFFL